ncbi:HNH endonuclease [Bacillus fonticola]|uniref:HNH endonuclease n=1 Tax=Bacillus fonticola TaxID=2728853 RepID=UPI00147561A8|nr:HNH endonuclease [Bacillus fonticola]
MDKKERFFVLADYMEKQLLLSLPFYSDVRIKKQLDRSKYWLIIKPYPNDDYFTFSYTSTPGSERSVRFMFTPDFKKKKSVKKKPFEAFMKKYRTDIAIALEVSKEKIDVTAQKWKGVRWKIESNPSQWNDLEVMEQYTKKMLRFVEVMKPLIEEWYIEAGYSHEIRGAGLRYDEAETLGNVETVGAPGFVPLMDESVSHISQTVKERVQQDRFREDLLKAYGSRCAISGEGTSEVLEAAHIQPYINEKSNHIQNGLVLRIDLHRLFDAGLLTVSQDYEIQVSAQIQSNYYQAYHGRQLLLPQESENYPSKAALALHPFSG